MLQTFGNVNLAFSGNSEWAFLLHFVILNLAMANNFSSFLNKNNTKCPTKTTQIIFLNHKLQVVIEA